MAKVSLEMSEYEAMNNNLEHSKKECSELRLQIKQLEDDIASVKDGSKVLLKYIRINHFDEIISKHDFSRLFNDSVSYDYSVSKSLLYIKLTNFLRSAIINLNKDKEKVEFIGFDEAHEKIKQEIKDKYESSYLRQISELKDQKILVEKQKEHLKEREKSLESDYLKEHGNKLNDLKESHEEKVKLLMVRIEDLEKELDYTRRSYYELKKRKKHWWQ